MSRSILFRMFHTKFIEKIKTRFVFDNFFLFENHAVCKIMLEKVLQNQTIHRSRYNAAHAHCMLNTLRYSSQYVTPIAFPLQQLLHERASMLRYTYMDCIVYRYCPLPRVKTTKLIAKKEISTITTGCH